MGRLIWPTTRGWVVALGMLAWLAIALVNHGVFPLFLMWFCLALLLVSLVYAIFSLQGVTVRRAAYGRAVAGQMLSLPLKISNRSRWKTQALVVQEKMAFTLEGTDIQAIPSVASHSELFFDRKVLPIRRGEYPLDILVLRSGDPAGLFRSERRFRISGSLVVYPPAEQLSDLNLHQFESLSLASGRPVTATGVSQDFFGVREYAPSDGMRFIHWKSSARFGRLMVKEFERVSVTSVAILLDADKESVNDSEWSNLEYLIRVAASICVTCAEMDCTLAVVTGGDKPLTIPPTPAGECCEEALYRLATMSPGKTSLSILIEETARTLPRNTVVFCLSLSAEGPALLHALAGLRVAGMDVRWYCADKEGFTGQPAKGERKHGDLARPVPLTSGQSIAKALEVW